MVEGSEEGGGIWVVLLVGAEGATFLETFRGGLAAVVGTEVCLATRTGAGSVGAGAGAMEEAVAAALICFAVVPYGEDMYEEA